MTEKEKELMARIEELQQRLDTLRAEYTETCLVNENLRDEAERWKAKCALLHHQMAFPSQVKDMTP